MIEIVDLALRAVIDSYAINCLIKNNGDKFITSKALFGLAQPEQTKKYCYYYWTKYCVIIYK